MEPAIFGTLLERALEKKERSRLGAHYTPRSYVERLVRPVVMEPLREEWLLVETEVNRLLVLKDGQEEPTKAQRDKAAVEIRAFLERLQGVRILDPACGSGNFLYVTLDLIKTLEQEVQMRLLDVLGKVTTDLLEEFDPRLAGRKQVNPSQFLGIEINPRAAAIAELVIWIGYLQWHFKRYGTTPPPEPILQDFHNIEFRDAVLAYDGRELDVDAKTGKVRSRWGGRTMRHPVTGEDVPDPSDQVPIYRYVNPRPAVWQEADYIVSNPPFIGNKRMRDRLGDGYVDALRTVHNDVPEASDLVMYWWNHSAKLILTENLKRFGLITTNSITQAFNRRVLQKYLSGKNSLSLTFAISDHPWVDSADDAAVRISMTVCELGRKEGNLVRVEKEEEIDKSIHITFLNPLKGLINSDLSVGADVVSAARLLSNYKLSGQGVIILGDGFQLNEEDYLQLIKLEPASNHLIKRYCNGKDVTDKSRNLRVIDLYGLNETEVKQYPNIYQRIYELVRPKRMQMNRKARRDKWWLFADSCEEIRNAINDLHRYIITCRTAKHRVFIFVENDVLPADRLIAFGLDDAFYLAVLSSSTHLIWALKTGGFLEDRPNYNHSDCFDRFPFPDATLEQKEKIRQLGERLDRHRKQVQAQHPEITITGMYNLLEKLRKGEDFTDKDREYNNKALVSTLKQIHDELDNAVLEAYGWEDLKPSSLSQTTDSPPSPPILGGTEPSHESKSPSIGGFRGLDNLSGEGLTEIILDRLVTLNAQRAEEERNGHIRWLRPEYQAPNEVRTQTIIEGVGESEEVAIAPAEVKTFPKQPKDQLAAIRDLLRTSNNPWTIAQIAAKFKNGGRYKNAISENLERLEWFGILHCHQEAQIKYWQHLETQQAS
ncbi:DNA methyltransferase [Pseudanabaena galeata UHCC 0370]|uniref:site-specific DNA-methyltransferase (adenine-specific) n=1 Tax=Pseudanabaena galeata UHCC 0370 TaxID=3110310 RepID=A0ABU5TK35_9CYAN|nr:DNA methyltransferase [Pseudanabaena galeata]MEA5478688.1 DNA methyltransferase [Pseudanabaena galeata UHCC 0370]